MNDFTDDRDSNGTSVSVGSDRGLSGPRASFCAGQVSSSRPPYSPRARRVSRARGKRRPPSERSKLPSERRQRRKRSRAAVRAQPRLERQVGFQPNAAAQQKLANGASRSPASEFHSSNGSAAHASAERQTNAAVYSGPEFARTNSGPPLPVLFKGSNLRNFEDIQNDESALRVSSQRSRVRRSAHAELPGPRDAERSPIRPRRRARSRIRASAPTWAAFRVLANLPGGLQYLPAAGSIALIEARHAGYLNTLLDLVPSENIAGQVVSFDTPLTPQQVVSIAGPFFVDLNGGPPLIPAAGFTSPVDLLNFALALEYLEAAFYNMNVERFDKILTR